MSNLVGGEHLSLATALYQLDFYLQNLGLPFTAKDLYAVAYRDRRGEHYDDRWLHNLHENPQVQESIHEPFTAQSIIETLMRTGHEPIVRALMREIQRRNIAFTQAYLIGTPRQ
jgi:hypothetical protein